MLIHRGLEVNFIDIHVIKGSLCSMDLERGGGLNYNIRALPLHPALYTATVLLSVATLFSPPANASSFVFVCKTPLIWPPLVPQQGSGGSNTLIV